ncbi:MAG: hypothetical protein K0Q94_6928, partial [Paenibacillus sp.]|nr:hypothetical protein [Paenibacillus sp.]
MNRLFRLFFLCYNTLKGKTESKTGNAIDTGKPRGRLCSGVFYLMPMQKKTTRSFRLVQMCFLLSLLSFAERAGEH